MHQTNNSLFQNISEISANLVDLEAREIFPARLSISDGKITSIQRVNQTFSTYLIPGFIDAHVHIESSMLVPSEFARIAVKHGTIATISDPHEIANVLGMKGVNLMIENGKQTPFHFFFGAPSCVPATSFETSGAKITSDDIEELLSRKDIIYLSEMMNFPGVIHQDPEVLEKLAVAKKFKKPIDGHAPGLMGANMPLYFEQGITTDHECYLYEEALEKLKIGVKIMIREGSAAKNFEELIPLLGDFPDQIMFCCDDKHPDNLLESHINDHVKRAIEHGHDVFDVLRAASLNAIKHYNLPIGILQEGDSADFLEVSDLKEFGVLQTIIGGQVVAKKGKSHLKKVEAPVLNQFSASLKNPQDFEMTPKSEKVRVIEALDGQLITRECHASPDDEGILKIAVVNRYNNAKIALGYIKNVGLQKGGIASSVAHDCHNIVAVGTNNEDLATAVNLIIEQKGGISLANGEETYVLPLPVAGIMTNQSAEEVAKAYIEMDRRAKELGSTLSAPYMTLSFMALLVIPDLKLSDLGLFSGTSFQFVDIDL